MKFGEYLSELRLHDLMLPQLEYSQAQAVQVPEFPLCVVRQQNIPDTHGIVQAELLAQHQGQPPERVEVRVNGLTVQFLPEFVVNCFEVFVERHHPAHNALLALVHILDVHIDHWRNQGRKHKEHLALAFLPDLLELQVVEGRQYLVHA